MYSKIQFLTTGNTVDNRPFRFNSILNFLFLSLQAMLKRKNFLIRTIFLFLIIISLGACRSEYQKVLKGNDITKKLSKAKELYLEKKDYFRAYTLFEELVNIYRGTDQAEEIYYYYAYCNYKLKDLISARYHFRTFSETFPKSQYAEECRYMSAYCYYLDSPKPSLDQENTYSAIEALQLFINLFPQSPRVEACNGLIDDLRLKLETKAFENAKLYFRIYDYKSAVTAFENAINDFPDSPFNEEMEFLTIKARYLYADNSIEAKQKERYKEVIENYLSFVDVYSKSKYLKDAEKYYEMASSKI